MNLRKNLILLSFLILLLSSVNADPVNAQNPAEEVKKAFQTGNANLLSSYFGNVVNLNITGEELHCDKAEAREYIQNFFANHTIQNFEIKFEGEKSNSNFLIGIMNTNSGIYRVNVFFKKTSSNIYIHLLRIEKDHGSTF